MRTKYFLQLAGLGFDFLPECYVHGALSKGRRSKEVEEPRADATFSVAWRTGEEGKAVKRWLARSRQYASPERFAMLAPGVDLQHRPFA